MTPTVSKSIRIQDDDDYYYTVEHSDAGITLAYYETERNMVDYISMSKVAAKMIAKALAER